MVKSRSNASRHSGKNCFRLLEVAISNPQFACSWLFAYISFPFVFCSIRKSYIQTSFVLIEDSFPKSKSKTFVLHLQHKKYPWVTLISCEGYTYPLSLCGCVEHLHLEKEHYLAIPQLLVLKNAIAQLIPICLNQLGNVVRSSPY
jgi:hypothetical protein